MKVLLTILLAIAAPAAFADDIKAVVPQDIAAQPREIAKPAQDLAVNAEDNTPRAEQISQSAALEAEEAKALGTAPATEAVTARDEENTTPAIIPSAIAEEAENMAENAAALAMPAEKMAPPAGETEVKTPALTVVIAVEKDKAETTEFRSGTTVLCRADKTKRGYLPRCAVPDGQYRVQGGAVKTLCYKNSQPADCNAD